MKRFMVVVLLLLAAGVQAEQHVVIVSDQAARDSDAEVVLLDGTDTTFADALERLDAFECDSFMALLDLPLGACDNAIDCASAIENACEAVDPNRPNAGTVVFSKLTGKCSGTCEGSGRSITVICVRPKR